MDEWKRPSQLEDFTIKSAERIWKEGPQNTLADHDPIYELSCGYIKGHRDGLRAGMTAEVVLAMKALIMDGRCHDPECRWHLDKKYPCPHHELVEKYSAEIKRMTAPQGEK